MMRGALKAFFVRCFVGVGVISLLQAEPYVYNSAVKSSHGLIAVGNSGAISRLDESSAWQNFPSNTMEDLHSIASNGSVFVAVGNRGVILVSEDGISWVAKLSGVGHDLKHVVWGGEFFAVYGIQETQVLTSVTGGNWVLRAEQDPILATIWHTNEQAHTVMVLDEVVTLPDRTLWLMHGGQNQQQLQKVFWGNQQIFVREAAYTIQENTGKILYEEWEADGQLQALSSGPTDDANCDGISNLLAYALGLNPTGMITADHRQSMISVVLGEHNNQKLLRFERPSVERGDIKYILEKSHLVENESWTTLSTRTPFGVWQGSQPVTEKIMPSGRNQITVILEEQLEENSCFYRIRVELLEN